jgi:hypothetical protein
VVHIVFLLYVVLLCNKVVDDKIEEHWQLLCRFIRALYGCGTFCFVFSINWYIFSLREGSL